MTLIEINSNSQSTHICLSLKGTGPYIKAFSNPTAEFKELDRKSTQWKVLTGLCLFPIIGWIFLYCAWKNAKKFDSMKVVAMSQAETQVVKDVGRGFELLFNKKTYQTASVREAPKVVASFISALTEAGLSDVKKYQALKLCQQGFFAPVFTEEQKGKVKNLSQQNIKFTTKDGNEQSLVYTNVTDKTGNKKTFTLDLIEGHLTITSKLCLGVAAEINDMDETICLVDTEISLDVENECLTIDYSLKQKANTL